MEQKVSFTGGGFEKIVFCYTAVVLEPLQRGKWIYSEVQLT